MYNTLINSYKDKLLFIIILICLCNSSISFSQDNIATSEENKIVFKPTFHSIQLDATIFILMYEVGGQFDYDLFSNDRNNCFGTRLSIEHYNLGDLGGKVLGSPFTNYNIFVRFSNRLGFLSITALGGISYYTTDDPLYISNKYLPRIGFEIKFTYNVVGLLLKGSTSLIDKSGFIGVGVSLGFNHN